MYETFIRRTLFVSACPCGERQERAENPPKERLCKCGKWVPYVAESYLGPDYGTKPR